ncbi:hypothetical protein TREMEDRAFT_59164 [Tremella mesenterica DSM 1558]|uniref:uncharacterized protein n=1 Tax=Tremella mesenterica (strain ATCC 24925 / CBS 8224 / DSM 1558 / NBRC 9311 / NRRL Y-6157 / RJB 2259-6 / UBC 559-6) TaxID=578456 RepID=UPI0003F49789|nr:uncharacterized protein TREMEDRAFT_59164 [Tremella mesenterica DSM 1558]EIW73005.1 hypothetical protein TREMEDRAFT_59164 [Tremella mesenterica DSM 1558]
MNDHSVLFDSTTYFVWGLISGRGQASPHTEDIMEKTQHAYAASKRVHQDYTRRIANQESTTGAREVAKLQLTVKLSRLILTLANREVPSVEGISDDYKDYDNHQDLHEVCAFEAMWYQVCNQGWLDGFIPLPSTQPQPKTEVNMTNAMSVTRFLTAIERVHDNIRVESDGYLMYMMAAGAASCHSAKTKPHPGRL